ncbi:hypothetical protein G8S55_13445 [Clostridium botulinum C]|uniref:hypothetical protein n=1 Tax=Clostridium botulinum TaxID=1491 RepID=UPI001E385173|nr:hypothetical protein [Clostridium botulinum]MCD3218186.1 hypothetical protein [Clostridium botulinum C]
MDRKKFDMLDLKSQVKYINKRLILGESLRKISDDIGIQRKTIRVRFKKINYEFNKESNKYIYNTNVVQRNKENKIKKEYECNTNIIQDEIKEKDKLEYNCITSNEKENKYKEYKENTIILQDNVKEDFFQLIEAKEELFKMMQWFKKQQFKDKIIEVPELKIDKDKFKGEVKVTTIRVYSEIKDKFQEFVRKFPEFKSQDLYTQALFEFMMKYDK